MKEYSVSELLKAIKGSAGIMSTIAKKLDCTWVTANTYCQKYEETRQALADENEAVLDLSESTLLQSIQNGDVQAAKWLLSVKGRKRGWGEKLEIDGTLGTYNMSKEARAARIAELEAKRNAVRK